MDYHKFTFNTQEPELLLAFIQDLPFDSFEVEEKMLQAYMPARDDTTEMRKNLHQIKERFDFNYSHTVIPYTNWNTVWESNFSPIRVGDFCGIRTDFHPPFDRPVDHEIMIQPKMAFGTGHHATTWMMIEQMSKMVFNDKTVLDYGCGTGILAILAEKLGAQAIDAVDIEPPAVENTIEHLSINNCSKVTTYEGTLDQLAKNKYQIILANINRNVILATLPTLYNQLVKGGYLLISGFIQPDTDLLQKSTQQQGFMVMEVQTRENWICMVLNKS